MTRAVLLVLAAVAGACGAYGGDDDALPTRDAGRDAYAEGANRATGDGPVTPPSSPDASARDAGAATTSDAGPSAADAGRSPADAAPPPSPCASPGPAVYEVPQGDAFRYALGAGTTLSFRGAPPTSKDALAPLYLSKSELEGDYLVTTVPSEGVALGYGPIADLGVVWLEPHAGAVPLVRWVSTEGPLRHRISLDPLGEGWDAEPPRGWVCPR